MNEKEYRERIESMLPSLYRASVSILKNEQDAADCVQEAILRGWIKRRQLKDISAFRAWMMKILLSEVRNFQRKAVRQKGAVIRPEPASPSPIPEALAALQEKYRLPLILFYMDGYSTREIAHMLSIPEGRLRERMRVARIQLRRLIESGEY